MCQPGAGYVRLHPAFGRRQNERRDSVYIGIGTLLVVVIILLLILLL